MLEEKNSIYKYSLTILNWGSQSSCQKSGRRFPSLFDAADCVSQTLWCSLLTGYFVLNPEKIAGYFDFGAM